MNSIELLEQIAVGSQSIVHKANYNGQLCAIKQFIDEGVGFPEKSYMTEKIILQETNIITMYGYDDNKKMLMLPLAEMDLFTFSREDHLTSMKTLLDIMTQLLADIQKVHSTGYVHKDVKPENVLLFKKYMDENNLSMDKYRFCLVDFALADKIDCESVIAGTKHFMPRNIRKKRTHIYNGTEDTYAALVLFFDLLDFIKDPKFEVEIGLLKLLKHSRDAYLLDGILQYLSLLTTDCNPNLTNYIPEDLIPKISEKQSEIVEQDRIKHSQDKELSVINITKEQHVDKMEFVTNQYSSIVYELNNIKEIINKTINNLKKRNSNNKLAFNHYESIISHINTVIKIIENNPTIDNRIKNKSELFSEYNRTCIKINHLSLKK